jgi:para-nitrobenzyl esterase
VGVYRAARADAGHGDVMAAVVTDWFFRIPAIRVAEAHDGPTWMYRFDYWSPSFEGKLGACHATEIPFVFDTLDDVTIHPLVGTDPPQAVADVAHAAWVRFVADGDPGWPRYDTGTRTTALLDAELTVVDDPDGAEREIWTGRR